MTGGDEELDRLMTEFQDEITELQGLQAEIEQVRGRGEAAEGRIVAQATMTGALAGLKIDPRALKLGSDELAKAILEAAGAAARDAAEQTKVLMNPHIPDILR